MPGHKVLVVDDSWTELAMIATPLRNSGFDVVTAVDGDEALEKVYCFRCGVAETKRLSVVSQTQEF